MQLVNQECPTDRQSLRDRKTTVTRREGRIKIPSTQTHPSGMSMAVSELPNLHLSTSSGEHDLYKLFLTNIDVLGQGIITVIPKTIRIIASLKKGLTYLPSFPPLLSRRTLRDSRSELEQ